jgi:hypothetical protein
MIKIFTAFLFLINITMAQEFDFPNRLYNEYDSYREPSIQHRRFKHSEIVPLINQLKNKNIFTVNKAGQSAEGREIFLISAGTGKKKVFLWSQMHGDEPTATMALFDIFNFLSADDHFNGIRKKILSEISIYFMPMVNPDGAETYERRNIFDIDINRDAIRQQTPEGKVLRTTFEELKADFGFNLHDQSTRYSVGKTPHTAALSFLAPTINYEKEIDKVRENAIKLIGELFRVLSIYIPGHIAKYSDDFEPRAFGDNFQKWGTSTILIESGGWQYDTEKQFLRKLNFISLLSAFNSIAIESYKKESMETYESIPFNDDFIKDVILRNLEYERNGFKYIVDIGINREEINTESAKNFYTRASIDDIGDLSVFYGKEDYNFEGMDLQPGKTYPKEFKSIREISNLNFNELYKDGFTNVILNSDKKEKYINLPVNIVVNRKSPMVNNEVIDIGETPNLVISKGGEVIYVVINGYIVNLHKNSPEVKNGLVF